MSDISVFANFFIDDSERLKKLQYSFFSFKGVKIKNWVINIRGRYKKNAETFLKKNIDNKKIKLFFIESESGWIEDSLKISKYLKSQYVFYWIEDHICIGGYKFFNNVIKSLYKHKIDYLPYSWFFFGKNIKSFNSQTLNSSSEFFYKDYYKNDHLERLNLVERNNLIADIYIISCCSIMNKKIFVKLLSTKDRIFLKWNKFLPFNFEKDQYDMHWLPYRIGILKRELFASIDDDLGCKGYSLISRGKYKSLKIRSKNKTIKKNKINFGYLSIIKFFLKTNINKIYRFLFF